MNASFIPYDMQLDMKLENFALESVDDDKKPHGSLPRLVAYLHEVSKSISTRFFGATDTPFVAHDFQHTIQKLEHIPWTSLREKSFTCVPGLKKDYVSYVNAVHDAAEHLKGLDAEVLSPIIRMLAEHVTHPGKLASYAPDSQVSELVKSIPVKETGKAVRHALSMVETHPTFNRKPYGKLVKRNADWQEISTKVQYIRSVMEQLDRKTISVKVGRLNQIFADITDMLKPHGDEHDGKPLKSDVTKVTRHIALELAKAAHAAAQMVEYYAMIQHRALALQEALAKLSGEINALK